MKKIEEQICKSFESMKHNSDECVKLSSRDLIYRGFYGNIGYFDKGNCIFVYEPKVQRFSFSLCGNNTATTRGKLKALLNCFCNSDLYLKQGKVYLVTADGIKHEINANNYYAIDSNNNFRNI